MTPFFQHLLQRRRRTPSSLQPWPHFTRGLAGSQTLPCQEAGHWAGHKTILASRKAFSITTFARPCLTMPQWLPSPTLHQNSWSRLQPGSLFLVSMIRGPISNLPFQTVHPGRTRLFHFFHRHFSFFQFIHQFHRLAAVQNPHPTTQRTIQDFPHLAFPQSHPFQVI